MEQINKFRSTIVLGLLVLFLILFGFYLFSIRPVNEDIKKGENEISMLEQDRTLLENRIAQLKNDTSSSAPAAEAALVAIPEGDDSEDLIRDLKKIGDDTHARLKDISFSLTDSSDAASWEALAGKSITGLKEIKMTAVVEGGYTQIHDWLKQLNLLPRLVSIDTFAFQQPYEFPGAQGLGSILTANVSFTAYYADQAGSEQSPKE